MVTKSKKRNSLSDEQKLKYIDKQVAKRGMKKNRRADMTQAKMKLSFDCKACIHKLTKNCKSRKNGCIYYFNAIKDKFGPGYAA